MEQQIYYKAITEACVGSDEVRRTVSSFLFLYIIFKQTLTE